MECIICISTTHLEKHIYVSVIPQSELSIKFIMFYHLVIDVVLKETTKKWSFKTKFLIESK